MKKKILIILTTFLVLSIAITSFVLAKPWSLRNNEKFETFDTDFLPNFAPIIAAIADPEWVNPNKAITSWVEIMDLYTISVDGVDYFLGTDFLYTGVAAVTANGGPILPAPPMGILNGKQNHFRVEYMYDFGDGDGGIDGTITMLALTTSGPNRAMHIRSLQGTGDLQNVVILATGGGGFTHTGIVSGWPE
jgi:hypothetical protein